MNIRLLLIVCCIAISISTFAQASGGEIRRSVKKKIMPPNKNVKKKNKEQYVANSQQDYLLPPPPPNIQPISIEDLPTYNVVVGTMGIIGNAQRFCQTLREQGYSSQIYWDHSKKLYRIIIGGSYYEQEALSLRSNSRQTYPDAWILYVVNGKEERYF